MQTTKCHTRQKLCVHYLIWSAVCVSLVTGPGLSGLQRLLSAVPTNLVTTTRIPEVWSVAGWCDASITPFCIIVCCRYAFVSLQPAKYFTCSMEDGEPKLIAEEVPILYATILSLMIYTGVTWGRWARGANIDSLIVISTKDIYLATEFNREK